MLPRLASLLQRAPQWQKSFSTRWFLCETASRRIPIVRRTIPVFCFETNLRGNPLPSY